MAEILVADRVVTGWQDWTPGWIEVDAGWIVGCGAGDRSGTRIHGTIMPGFVDIHAHGALGVDFGSGTLEGARAAARYHAARGTTTLLATIATAAPSDIERGIRTLRPLVEDDTLAGLHLEGPYLSIARRGAHNPALLREPDLDEIARLIEAGAGALRVVTIAPELEGAEAVVRWLVASGVTVAIGHTDCDAETARAAFGWGITLATHLFNGMPELEHRHPGPVGAALIDDRVTIELILDGHHVSREATEVARRSAPRRLALVSDAMAATGQPDGDYEIAGSRVHVSGGVAMLADGWSLAGSTKTISDCLPQLLDLDDMTPLEAALATSISPALAIGIEKPGIQVGAHADLLVLESFVVAHVMRRGIWVA